MVMRVYRPDEKTDPDGRFEPVGVNFTLAEAIAESRKGYLILWTPKCERFGLEFKVPGAYSDFYLDGKLVRNPWACFLPLPCVTPIYVDDGLGSVAPMKLVEIAEELFDEFENRD